jgi:hypothetical protein
MHNVDQHNDTTAEARAVMLQLYDEMSPARKLRIVSQLTIAAHQLALCGLRARHPDESERALFLRLARFRLGDALVDSLYGAGDS